MKKYFIHVLKKNLIPLAVLTLFCMLLYVVPLSVHDYRGWNAGTSSFTFHYCEAIIIALALLAVFIPMYMFAFMMNKRNADMYFSLPITRRKIVLVHFLIGLIMMYAAYTVAYWLGFLVALGRIRHLYLIYYLYLYLATLIPAFICYSITAFVFTRANTVVDGVISVLLALAMPFFVALAFDALFRSFGNYSWVNSLEQINPFGPLITATDKLGDGICEGTVNRWFHYSGVLPNDTIAERRLSDMILLICHVAWLPIAIAATVGLLFSAKTIKAENCGQISESIFCYKVSIPVYAVTLLYYVFQEEYPVVVICAIVVGLLVLSVIYKRTIKIGWKFAAVLFASLAVGCLLAPFLYLI